MNKRNLIIGLGTIALTIAWYAFRPELLFINKTVNEQFPVAQSASMAMSKGTEPMVLGKGDFRGLAHETKGAATVHQLADGKRILRLTDFERPRRACLLGRRRDGQRQCHRHPGRIYRPRFSQGQQGRPELLRARGCRPEQIQVRQHLVRPLWCQLWRGVAWLEGYRQPSRTGIIGETGH